MLFMSYRRNYETLVVIWLTIHYSLIVFAFNDGFYYLLLRILCFLNAALSAIVSALTEAETAGVSTAIVFSSFLQDTSENRINENRMTAFIV